MTNLSALSVLSLRNCRLQGRFPEKIFQLPNLHFLSVSSNVYLTGNLPEFDQETSPLTYLAINGCSFTGKVPSSIANLTQLVHLKIAFNNFSSELPSSIGNLASLRELDICGSYFSGQIPYSLSNLSN